VIFEPLPEDLALFIFLHPAGASASQFALATKGIIVVRTIKKWIEWNKVEASRSSMDGRTWIIAQSEMIRVATLVFNWRSFARPEDDKVSS
jgi:hypothetical protein